MAGAFEEIESGRVCQLGLRQFCQDFFDQSYGLFNIFIGCAEAQAETYGCFSIVAIETNCPQDMR